VLHSSTRWKQQQKRRSIPWFSRSASRWYLDRLIAWSNLQCWWKGSLMYCGGRRTQRSMECRIVSPIHSYVPCCSIVRPPLRVTGWRSRCAERKKGKGTVSARSSGPTELDRRLAWACWICHQWLWCSLSTCLKLRSFAWHLIECFPPLATDHCLAFPVIIHVPPKITKTSLTSRQ
jgi:hypothetical protein